MEIIKNLEASLLKSKLNPIVKKQLEKRLEAVKEDKPINKY